MICVRLQRVVEPPYKFAHRDFGLDHVVVDRRAPKTSGSKVRSSAIAASTVSTSVLTLRKAFAASP
jgi:hypothetical protein